MKISKRKLSASKLQAAAKILKTIAHPVKLEILAVLEAEEPLDVSTICSRIGADCEFSMMSHHLAKMKDNGIVSSKKIGKQVYYRLTDRKLLSIFDCIEKSNIL